MDDESIYLEQFHNHNMYRDKQDGVKYFDIDDLYDLHNKGLLESMENKNDQ